VRSSSSAAAAVRSVSQLNRTQVPHVKLRAMIQESCLLQWRDCQFYISSNTYQIYQEPSSRRSRERRRSSLAARALLLEQIRCGRYVLVIFSYCSSVRSGQRGQYQQSTWTKPVGKTAISGWRGWLVRYCILRGVKRPKPNLGGLSVPNLIHRGVCGLLSIFY
jgi:hypothetical protein